MYALRKNVVSAQTDTHMRINTLTQTQGHGDAREMATDLRARVYGQSLRVQELEDTIQELHAQASMSAELKQREISGKNRHIWRLEEEIGKHAARLEDKERSMQELRDQLRLAQDQVGAAHVLRSTCKLILKRLFSNFTRALKRVLVCVSRWHP